MTSPWSREYAESRAPDSDDVVEVTLDDLPPERHDPSPWRPAITPATTAMPPTTTATPTPPSPTTTTEPDAPPPAGRWRPSRPLLVVSIVLAVALAIAGVIAVVGDEDGGETGVATTLDPFLLSDSVTTPPTLEAIDAPAATTVPVTSVDPESLVAVPVFESVPGVSADELAQYDLTEAAARNAPGTDAMRSRFNLGGFVLVGSQAGVRPARVSVTVSSDPAAQRDELAIEVGDTVSRTVVDRAAHTAFRSSPALPEGRWIQFSEADVVEDTGASTLDELFDALITGPITPDLLTTATVVADAGLVRIDGGAITRRYQVEVAFDAITPPGALMFVASPTAEVTGDGAEGRLRFDVYVTDQPSLALVVSRIDVDGDPRSFTQFFDRRPANVRIELPSADAVVSPATTAPT